MQALLIHGMGRTPLSMCIFALRLRHAGIKPRLFAYTVTFETWDSCMNRLKKWVDKHSDDDFIIIGHSLGTVLTRAVLPTLSHKPLACFFLAPPTQACTAARIFAPHRWYRLLAGEMGQLLANPAFMDNLPVPGMLTKIYSGAGGPRNKWFFLAPDANDGILQVKETLLPPLIQQTVTSLHTVIMNNKLVTQDIVKLSLSLSLTHGAKDS